MTGDGVAAEYVSRHFWVRCMGRLLEGKWTPEWSNLRGGALLAIGRAKDAKPFFEDALRRKPELKSARKNLERCK